MYTLGTITTQNKVIPVNISDLGTVTKLYGITYALRNGNIISRPLPFASQSGTYVIQLDMAAGNITIGVQAGQSTLWTDIDESYVFIEYTKTTDSSYTIPPFIET